MKISVRYQSRNGNTKAVAEAIADAAGTEAQSIDNPIKEPVDVLFVGGGVYMWDVDKSLRDFLTNLNPDTVKSAAIFSTGGSFSCTHKIAEVLNAKGINVCSQTLSFKMGIRNNSLLGGKGHITLTPKQLNLVADFVKNTTTNL